MKRTTSFAASRMPTLRAADALGTGHSMTLSLGDLNPSTRRPSARPLGTRMTSPPSIEETAVTAASTTGATVWRRMVVGMTMLTLT